MANRAANIDTHIKQQLIKVPLTDNPSSFNLLIQQHQGILFKVANTYCKNDEDRKDLLQEMMIQLWRSAGRYNAQAKISTWIYRIALNVAISFYRKNAGKSNLVFTTDDTAGHIADTSPPHQEHQLQLLEQFIDQLKELDKALILLYLDQKSHREMADILGITETNVATKIGRIKEKLKQRFSQH